MPRQPEFDRLITLKIPGEYTGVDQSGQPVYEDDVDRRVWATRLDSPSANDLSITTDRSVEIRERRYVIRLENAAGVVTDMTVIDEDGQTVEIRGLRQFERRFLELQVREVG
jgi:hypothetical protein